MFNSLLKVSFEKAYRLVPGSPDYKFVRFIYPFTATTVVALLGIHPYLSRSATYEKLCLQIGMVKNYEYLEAQQIKKFIEEQEDREKNNLVAMEYKKIGLDNEDSMIELFKKITGFQVDRPGFIPHPRLDGCGCSPDALFFKDGEVHGLELKTIVKKDKKLPLEKPFIDHVVQCVWCANCVNVDDWYLMYQHYQSRQYIIYRIHSFEKMIRHILLHYLIPFNEGSLRKRLSKGEKNYIIARLSSMYQYDIEFMSDELKK